MKNIEVEVTEKHANEGIPGEAGCCAIALAIKNEWFEEDHLHVEVNSNGTITILMDGEYEEDTGVTPRIDLYTFRPDEDDEVEITNFIHDYDSTPSDADYSELDYMKFPYKFKFFRLDNA